MSQHYLNTQSARNMNITIIFYL